MIDILRNITITVLDNRLIKILVRTAGRLYNFKLDFSLCTFSFLGNFTSSTITLFSEMIPTDHITTIPLPISDAEIPLNDSAVTTEVDNKVKTKLLSMWNNVKYGLSSLINCFAIQNS